MSHSRQSLHLFLPLLLLLCRLPVSAASLLAPGDWGVATPHPTDLTLQTITVKDTPGGGPVLRLTVKTPSIPAWQEQIVRSIPADIPAQSIVRLHFWARSLTRSPLRASIEQNKSPYQTVCDLNLLLTPEWQEFTAEGPTPGYGPNGLSAHFQVGQQAGTVDIASPTVVNTGPDPFIAAARDALRPQQIDARISKYRKGPLTIRVLDSSGKPVSGATVHITQTRHAFLFGCNFFGLTPTDQSPTQQAYRNQFAALFNYATLPFYWGAYEPQPGQNDAARLQSMAQWCAAHDIVPKGHPLIWHQVWPAWAPSTADAAIPLLKARVFNQVVLFSSTIRYWDLVNEATAAALYRPANGETAWIARAGAASVVGTALGWAHQAAKLAGSGPPETFLYNDYETGSPTIALLSKLKAQGRLPDAIGIQSHMHTGEWPDAKIWQVCQSFAEFGKPIHFTETTVLSGPRRTIDYNGPPATDWNTTPEGEAQQADYVSRFYTILFSHPSVRAITWWDFSDQGAWLGAPAGLVRRDMTPKPAYTRLLALIHHQWWTNTTNKTNQAGVVASRVFYGDYQITVTDSIGHIITQTITFPEGAPPRTVTVRLPK